MPCVPVTRDYGEFFLAGVKSACGMSWDSRDIARFLSKCRFVRTVSEVPLPGGGTLKRRHICLEYTGARSSGGASYDRKNNKKRGKGRKQYGSFTTKGKTVRAHKFFAVAVMGLRPGHDDEIDHTCYNTRCVSCLECVPREVNQARIRRRGKSHVAEYKELAGATDAGPVDE